MGCPGRKTTNFTFDKLKYKFRKKLYHNGKSKTRKQESVDPDEVGYNELPDLELRCLRIQIHVVAFLAV